MLNIALLGCGLISEDHIRAYQKHADRARIAACCDIDPEKAAQRAALVGEARAVTTLEEALAECDAMIAAAREAGTTLGSPTTARRT